MNLSLTPRVRCLSVHQEPSPLYLEDIVGRFVEGRHDTQEVLVVPHLIQSTGARTSVATRKAAYNGSIEVIHLQLYLNPTRLPREIYGT